MGKDKREDQWRRVYDKALELTSDGSFSADDYQTLSKSSKKHKLSALWGDAGGDHSAIAKALSENNAVLDNDAKKLANKYNKGGLTQSKDSSGRLHTSFNQSTGGRRWGAFNRSGQNNRKNEDYYDAPITGIRKENWTQYTPNGPKRSNWDVYTRTYAHSPAAAKDEPVVETTPTPEPEHQPSQELTDTRDQWNSQGTGGSIHYDPTSGKTGPGVVGGVGAAADYGNRATDDYQERFIPHLNLQAKLESLEMGDAGSRHLDRFEGKVPELASDDIKDLYKYYSKKIKA